MEAAWIFALTFSGVVTTIVIGVCGLVIAYYRQRAVSAEKVAEKAEKHRDRLTQRERELEREKMDYLLRLAECEHDRKQAEQSSLNWKRALEILRERKGEP